MTESPYRVLVIEDDDDVALFTRTVLQKRAGCEVRSLSSADGAIRALSEFAPGRRHHRCRVARRERTRHPRAGQKGGWRPARRRDDRTRIGRLRGASAARPRRRVPHQADPVRRPRRDRPASRDRVPRVAGASPRADRAGDRSPPRRRRDRRRRHPRRARSRGRSRRHPHPVPRGTRGSGRRSTERVARRRRAHRSAPLPRGPRGHPHPHLRSHCRHHRALP